MASSIPPSQSWRSLALSRVPSFRSARNKVAAAASYVSDSSLLASTSSTSTGDDGQPKARQSWNEWARQKLPRNNSFGKQKNVSVEKVLLFPGWAARRQGGGQNYVDEFAIDIHVSGFASSLRPPQFATRSQRAFMRIAKGFAALPKLEEMANNISNTIQPPLQAQPNLSRSTEDLLKDVKLPPVPAEMTADLEEKLLEAQWASLIDQPNEEADSSLDSSSTAESSSDGIPAIQLEGPLQNVTSSDELRRLHENLDSRLQPFWSSTLPNRAIHISIYAHQPTGFKTGDTPPHEPIHTASLFTNQEGFFSQRFTIPYETLCTHPSTVDMVFGDQQQMRTFSIQADLFPTASPPTPKASMPLSQQPLQSQEPEPTRITTSINVPVSQAPIRLISDIDDTIKVAEILSGARAAFQNVFTKHHEQLIVPGMPEWYQSLRAKGVAFHYVSNSPFELLPVLSDFFKVAGYPEGSLKLKFYGGRSLFRGLWAAPADRKRSGVIEVLDHFPDSRFFLVGDSGEQDLELYADIARERPDQILGVFVRDVSPPSPAPSPIITPNATWTSEPGTMTSSPASASATATPTGSPSISRRSSYFGPTSSPELSIPGAERRKNSAASITSIERRRKELQTRMVNARLIIPSHVAFKVFRDPEECVEAVQIVDRLMEEAKKSAEQLRE